jgi:hypothetical protein
MMRLIGSTVLAGMVAVIGGAVMLGWLYEGPRRLIRIAACYIGFHGPETWGVNPANQNSEPQCRDCGRFHQKAY